MPPIFFNREAARRRSSRRFMPEIQALRAIAVGLVVAFHLYPTKWFASGFVGVDVFFVISGYLITSHLLKEMDRTGTVRFLCPAHPPPVAGQSHGACHLLRRQCDAAPGAIPTGHRQGDRGVNLLCGEPMAGKEGDHLLSLE